MFSFLTSNDTGRRSIEKKKNSVNTRSLFDLFPIHISLFFLFCTDVDEFSRWKFDLYVEKAHMCLMEQLVLCDKKLLINIFFAFIVFVAKTTLRTEADTITCQTVVIRVSLRDFFLNLNIRSITILKHKKILIK